MTTVGRTIATGAWLGAAAGVGWILLSIGLLDAWSIVVGSPAQDLGEFAATALLTSVFSAPLGSVVGVVSGALAGCADHLFARRLTIRFRWAPALGGAAVSVVPCWVAYVASGAASDSGSAPFTGTIVVVTAVYLFAFAAFSARRHASSV